MNFSGEEGEDLLGETREIVQGGETLLKRVQWHNVCAKSIDFTAGRVSFPSLWDLSDLGIELRSPALWEGTFPSEPPGKANH